MRALAGLAWLAATGCGSSAGESDGAPVVFSLFERAWISGASASTTFQRVSAPVTLAGGPFSGATLNIQLESACYPFESWSVPLGERWPADCDPYDRVFEMTLHDPQTAAPPLELMRAVTPFGGPMRVDIDVTDVLNAVAGERTVEVFISTYADPTGQASGHNAGWTLSAGITATPGPPPRSVVAVVPLLKARLDYGVVPGEMQFVTPGSARAARLEYRVTGHGGGAPTTGCIGPAEEFCRRLHHLWGDGGEAASVVPWRDDCDTLCTRAIYNSTTYCLENPTGAIASVEAPRANWCPGSVTPPLVWDLPQLVSPGDHRFLYAIDNLADGGNWRVSATLFWLK